MAYKSITISSGHGKKVAGASGVLNEVTEARKVVNKVAEYLKQLGVAVKVFHDDTSTTQNGNLSTIVNYHNSQSRELDVSVHFNSIKPTSSPMGTEVLYYDKKAEASALSKAIAAAGGLKDRGGKERKELYFLRNTNKPALLIEVCFVDSTADAQLYNKNFDRICRAIAENLAGKSLAVPQPSPAPTTKKYTYRVIAGSYSDKVNAEKRVASLKAKGFDSFIVAEEVK